MSDDLDKTLIRPRPGFRPGPGEAEDFRNLRASTPEAPAAPPHVQASRWNPLVEAALPLLFRATQIRNTATWEDLYGLRAQFLKDLAAFDQQVRRAGESAAALLPDARYALCTFVDEAVLNTPWGGQSRWQEESLLSTLFNETWGGDRFFAILDRAKQQPGRNLFLLELLFACLVLGFEGKYHVLDRGQARLAEVIDDLFRVLRAQRGEPERSLSPHWRGVESGARRITSYLPLWVLAALATALLVSLYLGFFIALSQAADPVFAKLSRLERQRLPIQTSNLVQETPTPEEPPMPPPEPVSKLHLRELLQPEIELGLLHVKQDGLTSLIRFNSDTLFRSGSAKVAPRFLPILERIAKAIDQVEGRVLVVGHSDNVPIHTLQFPSNWELSRARARNVMDELAKYMGDPKRMIPEGRADTEPLVPNDTKAHRARNRRVEIIVYERESL